MHRRIGPPVCVEAALLVLLVDFINTADTDVYHTPEGSVASVAGQLSFHSSVDQIVEKRLEKLLSAFKKAGFKIVNTVRLGDEPFERHVVRLDRGGLEASAR